jgi:hypothetical protein
MKRDYDEFLFFAKLLLGFGMMGAILLNVFNSYPLPLSARVALGFIGITFGVFGFSLLVIPWWLLQKGRIRAGTFSRRVLFVGHLFYGLVLVLPLETAFTFWFVPTIYVFALQIAASNVQWNGSLAVLLAVLAGGYLLSGLNMYCYIKEHKGF